MPHGTLVRPALDTEMECVRCLFREYAAGLSVSLCFQNFDQELAQLPGYYSPPRGALLLGECAGAVSGVVALRPASDTAAEMKRLYVQPHARNTGLGRKLAEAIVEQARLLGYCSVILDTLAPMTRAIALYRSLGFREISPYYQNPNAALYFQLDL
jgi:ribosomal protein S18 acetylase RimI-like enzyme